MSQNSPFVLSNYNIKNFKYYNIKKNAGLLIVPPLEKDELLGVYMPNEGRSAAQTSGEWNLLTQ